MAQQFGAIGQLRRLVTSAFAPDKILQNKELLAFIAKALEANSSYKTSHVLNSNTMVIDPPDGDMNDSLNSLAVLQNACAGHHSKFILPAHGYVIGRPRGFEKK